MRRVLIHTVKIPCRRLAILAIILGLGAVLLLAAYFFSRGQSIEALSWTVAGKVIVIDPGHGGCDPGTIGVSGSREKDINLKIARKLKTVLQQAGAVVIMTRENDRYFNDARKTSLWDESIHGIEERVKIAAAYRADLLISVHVNSFPSPRWRGAQVFYQQGSKEGKRLAELIQEEITRELKNTDRLAKEIDAYILRHSKMPAVIVETGFVSNPEEEKLLQDELYQYRLAWSIYAGIVRYLSEKKEG